MELVLKFSVG
ncbi:hypothetical protein VCHENC02_3465A, partial [Vibrio harveyi]